MYAAGDPFSKWLVTANPTHTWWYNMSTSKVLFGQAEYQRQEGYERFSRFSGMSESGVARGLE